MNAHDLQALSSRLPLSVTSRVVGKKLSNVVTPSPRPARPLDVLKGSALQSAQGQQLLGAAHIDLSSALHFLSSAGGADSDSVFAALERLALPGDAKARLKVAAAGGQGAQAAYDLQTATDGVQGLTAPAQSTLLGKMSTDPSSDDARHVADLVSSPAWKSATPEGREQLATLAGSCDAAALASLDTLANDPRNPLANRDAKGGTLLSTLVTMSSATLNPAIGNTTAAQVLDSTMAECADPDHTIDQSCYGTCTVTSIQYGLVSKNPAEYARLVSGLSTSGAAQMAGGGILVLQQEYYGKHLDGDDRSPSEIMFQNACMEYGADGGDASADDYDASTDEVDDSWILPDHQGLKDGEEGDVASQLFNRQYDYSEDSDALPALMGVDTTKLDSPVIVNVSLPGGKHAMDFVKVADGKVYFRNPWGPGYFENEGMTCEDPSTGLYSMSIAQFNDSVDSVAIPDANLSASGDVIGQATKAGG